MSNARPLSRSEFPSPGEPLSSLDRQHNHNITTGHSIPWIIPLHKVSDVRGEQHESIQSAADMGQRTVTYSFDFRKRWQSWPNLPSARLKTAGCAAGGARIVPAMP